MSIPNTIFCTYCGLQMPHNSNGISLWGEAHFYDCPDHGRFSLINDEDSKFHGRVMPPHETVL